MNPMLHFFPCQVRKQLHKKWSRYSFPWQFHMACQLNYAKCHPQCYYRDYHSANTQTHINTYKHIHPSLSQHKLLNFHCTFSNVFNSTVHILVSEKSIGQKSMLSSSISLSSGIQIVPMLSFCVLCLYKYKFSGHLLIHRFHLITYILRNGIAGPHSRFIFILFELSILTFIAAALATLPPIKD